MGINTFNRVYLALDWPPGRLLRTIMVTVLGQRKEIARLLQSGDRSQCLGIGVHLELVRLEAVGQETTQEPCGGGV